MKKDYLKWTSWKSNLHNSEEERLFFRERQIWYCHLGENVGFEQDGVGGSFLRPVVVTVKFNKEIFWAIPLTRAQKDSPFYFSFAVQTEDGPLKEKSSAILSQIRLTDAKRLRRFIGYISEDDFLLLTKKLKALLP